MKSIARMRKMIRSYIGALVSMEQDLLILELKAAGTPLAPPPCAAAAREG